VSRGLLREGITKKVP